MGLTYGLLFLFVLQTLTAVSSLTCLSCHGIFQPRHCHNVVECLPNEFCSVQRSVDSRGQVFYNVGCESQERCMLQTSSTDHCNECCNTTLCNAKGCGEPGYPSNDVQVCYNCDQISTDRTCYTIAACEQGEVCVVEETEEFGDVMVSSGCSHQRECDSVTQGTYIPSLVGRRDIMSRRNVRSNCKQCCNGTLCNKQCSSLNHASYPTTASTLKTSTTEITTSTTMATTQPAFKRDCLDILTKDSTAKTGAYRINHETLGYLTVWCDMDTDAGGWTNTVNLVLSDHPKDENNAVYKTGGSLIQVVLERRFNGSVDFYRNFTSYQNGFGNVDGGEFWLGLDKLYAMTKDTGNMLRIESIEYDGHTYYNQYSSFSIGPARTYTLHVSGSSGNGSNEMEDYFNGMAFSTMDEDQDRYSGNCAKFYRSACWFNKCYGHTNINAPYKVGSRDPSHSFQPRMTYQSSTGAVAITIMFKRN